MKNGKQNMLWAIIPMTLAIMSLAGILILGDFDKIMTGGFTILILAAAGGYSLLMLWTSLVLYNSNPIEEKAKKSVVSVFAILIFAIIVRLYIATIIDGYPSDMTCWTVWSGSAAGSGLFNIYSNTAFIDYPPGYIYVLHIIGTIGKLTGVEGGSSTYNILLKLPAIIADVILVWGIYKLCAKRLKYKTGLILAFIYAFNPLVLLDSAAWGQIDSVLTLAVAAYLLALYKEKIVIAALIFTAGLLVKPQMLFFGPVLALVFIQYSIKKGWGTALKTFFIGLFSGAALFIAVVYPFTGDSNWYWIFEKYMGTINSYNYITLNSANIFGLLGLNWMPTETVKMGLALGTWGLVGILLTVVVYFIIGFINRDRKNVFMLTVLLMTGIYAFGLKMHERYLFPILAILILAFIFDNKKEIPAMFSVLTAAIFVNVAQVLAVIHIPPEDIIFKVSSALVVISYIWIVVFCYKAAIKSYKSSKSNFSDLSEDSAISSL